MNNPQQPQNQPLQPTVPQQPVPMQPQQQYYPYPQQQFQAPRQQVYQQPMQQQPMIPQPQYQNPQQYQQQVPRPYPPTHQQVAKSSHDVYHQQELAEMANRIPKEKRSSFGSIEYRPRHVRFATQNEGEHVYLLVRRHWITNLGWVLRNAFVGLVPPIIFFVLSFIELDLEFVTPKIVFLGLLAFYSIIATNFFSAFFDWYFDPYILTNERIISYDFKPFTSYTIREATLDNIEDVRERSIGPVASLFNYGSIRILTASEQGEILFQAVPQPTKVRDIIADLAKIYKKYHFRNDD